MTIEWRLFSLIIDSLIGFLGISLNCLLLYLILTQSPTKIRTYRLLLINMAVNDMFTSTMMILLVPRVIGYEWTLVVASRGICSHVYREYCFVGISVFFATFSHFLLTLLGSFVYRYYVIRNQPPSLTSLFAIILTTSVPSFLIVVFFVTKLPSIDGKDKLMNIINIYYTDFELKDEAIYGFKDIRDWRIAYCILLMGGTAIPIYITVFLVRRMIMNFLGMQTVSQKGVKLQKELVKVLSWQAFLPTLFFITLILYVYSQTTVWTHPILECSVFFTVSLIPILSPCISIAFVRPYRAWLTWHFGSFFRRSNVTTVPVQPCTE